MNQNKELLLKFIKASDENEVEYILENDEYVKSLEWWPFNGTETNFSTINNQQTDAIAALAEKPINSIDAVLIKECKLRGINPESNDAPRTMSGAVEKFFSIADGDISSLGRDERRKLASDIRIIAFGDKIRPTLAVVDFGEGQNPTDFKETLLSLHKKNKTRIPFVQGKYGMGGTGVIPFCGTKKYQLILSRKHPNLLRDGQEDLWGFTLIRKTPSSKLNELDKHSWFECLVGDNSKILSFLGEELSILPDEENMEYGCYIRLFNYDLPRPSSVIFDLWRDLNRKLFAPALPVLIRENRLEHFKVTKRKDYSIILIGNKYRIKSDDRDFVYKSIPLIANLESFGERIVDVVVFKDFDEKGEDLRRRQEWTTIEESVFLTINGQTHFSLPKYWLKKTGLDFLTDYLFVHIDCTNVNRTVTDDIFLGSRDRIRENTDFRNFQKALIFALSTNEILQKLNEEYRERQLAKIKPDKSIAKQLVAGLISKNKNLMSYFGLGSEVPITEVGEETEEVPEDYSGLYIPTFLKPRKRFTGSVLVKEVPKNARHSVVLFDTDAQNNYFTRDEDKGILTWNSSNERAKISTYYLYNGMLPLRIIIDNPEEGEEFSFSIEVSRPRTSPLTASFQIKIIAEKHKGKPRGPSESEHTGVKLPELIVVRENPGQNEEDWKSYDWSASNVSKVEPGRIYVNMDCEDLKNYLAKCPKRIRVLAETIYKTGIYLNSIILDLEFDKVQSLNGHKTIVFNGAIGSISKTLLPLYLDPQIQKLAERD
ncbi:hypothetical protein HYV85_04555 [Candidatus Woesearchaeota archaeon]|nr:hypothetical protein [Candidatus Woesearchaeota archaeon]